MAVDPLRAGATAVAGYFGKLPGVGDFVQRRLPPPLVQRWDAHASAQLAEPVLRDCWQAAVRARAWVGFASAPGLLDAQAWAGLVAPLHDRVGRAYPLLLAVPLGAATDPRPLLPTPTAMAALDALLQRVHEGELAQPEALDAACVLQPLPLGAHPGLDAAWCACCAVGGSVSWSSSKVLPTRGLPAAAALADLLLPVSLATDACP